jgi:hypothetical protein
MIFKYYLRIQFLTYLKRRVSTMKTGNTFMKIITVYYEIVQASLNEPYSKIRSVINVKAHGTCSNHCGLKE